MFFLPYFFIFSSFLLFSLFFSFYSFFLKFSSSSSLFILFIFLISSCINVLFYFYLFVVLLVFFFTLLTAVIEIDGTNLSRHSTYDQFICRFWLTRLPLFDLLITSSYSLVLTALDRYVAVVHPVWYNNNVRISPLTGRVECATCMIP